MRDVLTGSGKIFFFFSGIIVITIVDGITKYLEKREK